MKRSFAFALIVPFCLGPTANIRAQSFSDAFGPRFGFAYDVNGDGKTVVRGGYGIYFGRVINSTVYNALINTGVGVDVAQRQFSDSATSLPVACTGTVPPTTADNCSLLPIYPTLISPSTVPVGAVQYFASNFQLPRIHQLDAVLFGGTQV